MMDIYSNRDTQYHIEKMLPDVYIPRHLIDGTRLGHWELQTVGSEHVTSHNHVTSQSRHVRSTQGYTLVALDENKQEAESHMGYARYSDIALRHRFKMHIDGTYHAQFSADEIGDLTIDCTDPDGYDEPVYLKNNFDGTYSLTLKPTKPGRHTLNVRRHTQHVLGSPYTMYVKGPPPKSILKVYGQGLDNGVFSEYRGTFYIDATGTGGGVLHVSVTGLKGTFNVEVRRASQNDNVYHCFYHPLEPGLYTIIVQWSGKHVGDSPYRVFVAESDIELLDYETNGSDQYARLQDVSRNTHQIRHGTASCIDSGASFIMMS